MADHFEDMSVIELRQKAKEMGVKLGAGINKQGIVEKLRAAAQAEPEQQEIAPAVEQDMLQEEPAAAPRARIITDDEEIDEEDIPVLTPNPVLQSVRSATPRAAQPAPGAAPAGSSLSTISAKAPAFTMEGSRAWHNPRAYQGPGNYQRTQPAQNTWTARPAQQPVGDQRVYSRAVPQQHPDGRVQQSRPVQQPTYVNRFGPDQGTPETENRPAEYRGYAAPAQPQDYSAPREGGYGYNQQTGYPRRENGGTGMTISDILAAGECGDGEGVLEVHPDGYGFLRTNHYLPGKQDVYISNAQIRRFDLRTGDYVAGKTRPQREADRYSAMLYITEVNGAAPEEMPARTRFEDLSAIYPKKRISLTVKKDGDPMLRLMDLMCPIGFGQRAMIMCGPKVKRLELLKKLAAVIAKNHSKAQLMLLLVDERPEEVTDIKESVKGEVIYSTFDEPAESQVRVTEMALERAMRMVEQKKDVIILADSLTRLGRACNVIAPQSARTMGGGLAAGALNKPKKFFGAARNTREGGSLTIVVTALYGTGSELDQAILHEFQGNSNMNCTLVQPASGPEDGPLLKLDDCGTIHDEWLLTEQEKALADAIRAAAADMQPEDAKAFLRPLLEANDTNEALAEALKQREEKQE